MREMTITSYINNPAGSGSATIANRELVRGDLMKRFEELFTRKRGAFNGNVYKNGDEYFIHVVIPSESKERENTYDVVIKFIPPDNAQKVNVTVKEYNIQVFSNSPSFTYTYAYVYDKEDLLVPELKKKYGDDTFNAPTTRNPYQGISFEKTTFMAVMYILANPSLLETATLNKGYSVSRMVRTIRNTDEIKIENAKEKNRLTNMKTSQEISSKKQTLRNISIEETSKPKKPQKPGKIKPTKPQAKVKPKAKITGRTSLSAQTKKRR